MRFTSREPAVGTSMLSLVLILFSGGIPSTLSGQDDSVILALKHRDWRVRLRAVETLGDLGPRAVEPLTTSLRDKNAKVRAKAVTSLSKIVSGGQVEAWLHGDNDQAGQVYRGAVAAFIAARQDKDFDVRFGARLALKALGPRAVEGLSNALRRDDDVTRRDAIESLVEIVEGGKLEDDRAAVAALVVALHDQDFIIRRRAVEALRKVGDAAVEPLMTALRDENFFVREETVRSLASIIEVGLGRVNHQNYDAAIEALIDVLKDKNGDVRRSAADFLGILRSKPVAIALDAVLDATPVDIEVVAGAYYYFIRKGMPGTERLLVEGLNLHGNVSMAQAFLNSGNEVLEDAAHAWAKRNGYGINRIGLPSGHQPILWGGSRVH